MRYENLEDYMINQQETAVYQKIIDETIGRHKLSPTEIAVLAYLVRSEKKEVLIDEVNEFGKTINRGFSSISTATSKLSEKGYISKNKNPADGREGILKIRKKGKDICEKLNHGLNDTKETIKLIRKKESYLR